MMRTLFRLFTALLTMAALSLPALAADRAMIILDASGSMWAQIDGKARIDIARDTLKSVLAGVPADLELGFMAYGHRSKGDCSDIETLVQPAAGTAAAIGTAADGLSPKGKTPLTAAVKMAAEQLKSSEGKATVILITDGIETCNADPCALATELAKSGVDLKVDVVGFGLSRAEGAQVKCLADTTGGKYLSADDATGLEDAMSNVVSGVTAPDTSSSEAPPSSSEEPVSDANFAPSAVVAKGSDPLVDGDGSVAWEFHSINADGSAGDAVRTEYGNAYEGTIDPGDYIVIATLDNVHVQQKVTIAAGQVAKPLFDFEAGYLDVRPHESEGADIDSGATVVPTFADKSSTTVYGEFKGYVPAGDTQLAVTIGSATVNDTATVAAGDRITRDVVVGAGHVNVTATYAEGVDVTDGSLYVDVFAAKKDIQGNRKEIGNGYGPIVQFDLPAGDYVAVASYDAVKVEQPFSVKSGDAMSFTIPLNAGVLAVTAPNGYYTEVFSAKKDIQGNRVSFGGSYDMAANRTLPAGDYHIVVTLANDAGTKESDATVKAGERMEITVQ